MANRKYIVTLTKEEREELEKLVQRGKVSGYKMRHAAILLKLDERAENQEWTGKTIAKAHNTNENSATHIAKRFAKEGLEAALTPKSHENHRRKTYMETGSFKTLYFKRWPMETKYGELEHKPEFENISGRTKDAVRQDFYITAYLSNMMDVAANETQPVIDYIREDSDNSYDYKVNKNHAVGVFKDCFIMALLEDNNHKRAQAAHRILFLLPFHATHIRPNRSVPRNQYPRKARFHFNQKSNC